MSTQKKQVLWSNKLSLVSGVIILMVLALTTFTTGTQAATIIAQQNVSQDGAQSDRPHNAQDPAGNVHVIWQSVENGTRLIRYSKGTWNGNGYSYGPSSVLDDTGGYGYNSPNIGVSPNGTVMAAWSRSDGLYVQTWNGNQGQPSGSPAGLGVAGSREVALAADSANRFHVVWNGNFQVQYCQFENGTCTLRTSFGDQGYSRPDVAVDSADNIHIVSDSGQNAYYRTRAAGAPNFNGVVQLGGGNYVQIAADGRGNVHIVYSGNYNVQYCQRTYSSGACTASQSFDANLDVDPSIGSTSDGTLLIAWREGEAKRNYLTTREGGIFTVPQNVASGPTSPQVTHRMFVNRGSFVWSLDYDIQQITAIFAGGPPPSTPPSGSLVIGDNSGYTNNLTVTARITNHGGTATTYSINGSAPQPFTPDQNGSMLVSTTLSAPAQSCQPIIVPAQLSGPGGTSNFSAAVVFDNNIQATVRLVNPNLGANQGSASAHLQAITVKAGDPNFTRESYALLYITPEAGECSGLNGYFVGSTTDTVSSPSDSRWQAYSRGPIVVNLPNPPQDGRTYTFGVFLRDNAGNITGNGIPASITYDVTGPQGTATNPVPTTASGSTNDVAHLDFSQVHVTDATYQAVAGKPYWGIQVLVTRNPTTSVADEPLWDQYAAIRPGVVAGSLDWNVYFGNSTQPPTANTTYYVHVRFVDGAGNVSPIVVDSQGVTPTGFGSLKRSYLPLVVH